jgi:hypothetical protein
MLDTIDKLTKPTVCSLLELTLAKVFPFQKACHSVPVQDGYVVVQPTYVWANAGHYPLPVPIDEGDVATLAEALVQRIQWSKDKILIPHMTRHPNPEAAKGSWVQHQMEVLQLSVSKRRLNNSSNSRLTKLRSVAFLSVAPGLYPRQWRQKCLLTFLSLTTKMVQTATVTEMLVDTYKRHRWVHTSSNGTRGRLG